MIHSLQICRVECGGKVKAENATSLQKKKIKNTKVYSLKSNEVF